MTKKESLVSNSDDVKTRDDLIEFFCHLANDFEKNETDWENRTLASFLEAAGRYLMDIEGRYQNFPHRKQDLTNPDWTVFAQVLSAARYYE